MGCAEGEPLAVKGGCSGCSQPPKGTIGFPSGSGEVTYFIQKDGIVSLLYKIRGVQNRILYRGREKWK